MPRHPHADLIKQWAEDTSLVIQCKEKAQSAWCPAALHPSWYPDYEYRIKPKENFTKVALCKASDGCYVMTVPQERWTTAESERYFVRWLTEAIPYPEKV